MGYDYITVQGNVASNRSANALAGSGEEGVIRYTITWSADNGFIDSGWRFNIAGNGIARWWQNNYSKLGYTNESEEEFIRYLTEKEITNLDEAFSEWSDIAKFDWIRFSANFGYDPNTEEFSSPCIIK